MIASIVKDDDLQQFSLGVTMIPKFVCIGLRLFAPLSFLMCLYVHSSLVIGEIDQGDAQAGELDKAWAQRSADIQSVHLRAEIDQITKGRRERRGPASGPLVDLTPKEDLHADVHLEYLFDRGKILIRRATSAMVNPANVDETVSQISTVAFNGTANLQFVDQEQTDYPMAIIEKSPSPGAPVLTHVDCWAMALWLYPNEVLEKSGWSPKAKSIEDEVVMVDGVRCRRVRVPRAGGWTSALDVDAERDYLPVRRQTWLNGRLTSSLTIKYREGESGPVVAEWSYVGYDESGKTESIRHARVTHSKVNEEIDDSRFAGDFSLKTHVGVVDEDGSRTYFIQTEDGLQPIGKDQFGRLSDADSQ